MQIFVMRHGEAEMMAESDISRHLTVNGREQVSNQATLLKSSGVDIHKVIVSPYIRAQESFEQIDIIYEHQLEAKKEIWDAITPYGNSILVVEYLSVLAKEGINNVLLISHLPLVSDIVAALCQQRQSINFYPSTMVCIEWEVDKKGILKKVY